jgi:segregation and condensation protein B
MSERREEDASGTGTGDLGLEQFLAPSDDQGLSLEALSRTYAQLLGSGQDPYSGDAQPRGEEPVAEQDEPAGEPPEETAEDPACPITPATILEAMLFVGHPDNEPLTSKKIAALMRGVSPREIDELVAEWNRVYEQVGAAYHIASAGAGYRLELRPELAPLRDKFHGRVKAARLSQAAIDVLAIVAYYQPLTKEEIERLRGRPVGGVLSQLVRRELLSLERTAAKKRRQSHYRTTPRFLQLFGLDKLEDLPRSQELDRSG